MPEATSKPLIIAYLVGILGLTSFAIYDLHAIIKDFVEDNRITSVKTVSVLDSIPFFRNVQICVYASRPLFPGRPISSEQLFSMAREYWLSGWNKSWNDYADFDKDQFEYYGKATLDDYTIYQIGAATENLENDPDPFGAAAIAHSTSKAELMRSWDAFLTTPKRLEYSKETWKAIQWLVFRREHKKTPTNTATSYFSWCYGCSGRFSIPLQNDMDIRHRYVHYHYDYPSFVNNTKDLPTVRLKVARAGAGGTMVITNGPTDRTKVTHISIYNTAVFSRSQFPPCTNAFDTEEDCLYDLKMKIVSDVCDCAIFTEILRKAMDKNETRADVRQLCTAAVLESCAKEAFLEARRHQDAAKADGICRACSIPKNTYTLVEVPRSTLTDSGNRGIVAFSCPDTAYLVFEDKPQFTWPQMISQIGGDLGLYIGFSMITVLQVTLVAYQRCLRWRRRPGPGGPWEWFRRAMIYVAKTARLSQPGIRENGHRTYPEDRLELLLKRQTELEQKMERLNKEIAKKFALVISELRQCTVKRRSSVL